MDFTKYDGKFLTAKNARNCFLVDLPQAIAKALGFNHVSKITSLNFEPVLPSSRVFWL